MNKNTIDYVSGRKVLMSKAKEVLEFDMKNGYITDIKMINSSIAPETLKMSEGMALNEWLRTRALDLTRSKARVLIKAMKVANQEVSIVISNRAMTLTDTYWIKEYNEDIKWTEVCLHRRKSMDNNEIKIAQTSLSGAQRALIRQTNPEFTNIGSFDKAWVIKDSNWYLTKTGSKKSMYSELFVSELLNYLKLPHVKYTYDKSRLYSMNFTNESNILEHYLSYMKKHNTYELDELVVYNNFKKEDSKMANDYRNILFIDALVNNFDRHEENFGVIKDPHTGEVKRLAPNYDNNLAFGGEGKPSIGQMKMYLRDFGMTNEQVEMYKKIKSVNIMKIHLSIKDKYDTSISYSLIRDYFTKLFKLVDAWIDDSTIRIQKSIH